MPVQWLSLDEAQGYLAANNTGRLATCDADGQPYIVPLNYVYFEGHIFFHCALAGKKLNHIIQNPKVCFEVSHTDQLDLADLPCGCATRFTSIVVTGAAEIIKDTDEKLRVLDAFIRHIAPLKNYPALRPEMAGACTVVKIEIKEISGKKNVRKRN